MNWQRSIILGTGPFVIVTLCYWLSMAGRDDGPTEPPLVTADPSGLETGSRLHGPTALARACEVSAAKLAQRLTRDHHVISHPPYVIAGNMAEAELERHYRQTILPTAAVLANSYFERAPNLPITILLFSDNASYRRYSEAFDGCHRDSYFGYYQKSERRMMINTATGNGTLAHELTHALADCDFPDMPEWFDEGLAALHEQTEFSKDGLRLLGVSNWRHYHLLYALRTGRLRSVDALIREGIIRTDHEALDYAHARYFCQFLQSRDLLVPFYKRFRDHVDRDPTGVDTLCSTFQTDSVAAIDNEFRHWILAAE